MSEGQAHRKLHLTWEVARLRDDTVGRGRAHLAARRRKLRPIENIEELGTELQVDAFRNGRALEYRVVEIGDALAG
jgi:hypothetical protein